MSPDPVGACSPVPSQRLDERFLGRPRRSAPVKSHSDNEPSIPLPCVSEVRRLRHREVKEKPKVTQPVSVKRGCARESGCLAQPKPGSGFTFPLSPTCSPPTPAPGAEGRGSWMRDWGLGREGFLVGIENMNVADALSFVWTRAPGSSASCKPCPGAGAGGGGCFLGEVASQWSESTE